ncbi:OmpH family outer membrane protein [Sphingomonas sp. ZT3P38]|uniref:OmpH family outer membrane protein n=1 Tax=Parasphingomonas zepuensis TaxID=3096161 RepID=UPI002FCB2251
MRIIALLPLLSLIAAPAIAQTSPAPQQGLGGTAVAGVCLLSREAIFANAKVGVAATARLKQLTDQAQAELDTERKPLEVEIQALQTDAAKLTPEQRRVREAALAPRLTAIQVRTQQRTREIEATRGKAMARIAETLQPLIAQVYKERNCGLLIDRTTVLGGNMTNDLTPAAVAALDAKLATIAFERETLPPHGTAP